MSNNPPRRENDSKRQPKPLVSAPLMNALREVRGMDENAAIKHVQRWNQTFGKGK